MKRSIGAIGLAAVLTTACGASVNVEQERTALMQRDREWSDSTKDPDRFASFFAADGSFNRPGQPGIRMGDSAAPSASTDLAAGGFAVLPAEMRHSFLARTAATVQVHGTGPFAITYVNPADDPRPQKK